ncbi:MAG: hypothetical protein V1716_02830 [Candidatus Uhrbacteria bacterium]
MEMPKIQPAKQKITKDQIFTIIVLVVAFMVGMYAPFYLFFLLGAAIGQWFGKWYAKRPKVSKGLIKFIAWSNVLTWLSIPIGLFTSLAVLELSKTAGPDSKKFKTLAIVGIVLSLLNLIHNQ